MIKKEWFEMKDIKKRFLNNDVWIPLKEENKILEVGNNGKEEYKEEYFAVGTLAIFNNKKEIGKKLEWFELGISNENKPYIDCNDRYLQSDIRYENDESIGICLVLTQKGNLEEFDEWHLHQDFILAYDLRREGDSWFCISEGYPEVARIKRNEDNSFKTLEVKAVYLKDYLCARAMTLRVSSYRSRTQIVKNPGELLEWEKNSPEETNETDRWECRVTAIGETGSLYGAKTAMLHVARNDVDPEIDVPEYDFPTDDVTTSSSFTKKEGGKKLYMIHGELWRNEWVEPAQKSPRLKNDATDDKIHFITNAEGKKETEDTLINGSRWLWFKPEVITEILKTRGSSLGWYTKDTGGIYISSGYNTHFGINQLGFINVYAKDIGTLPNWQQKIWSGFNIGPDGKVSSELLSSQMEAQPASTQAPENFLKKAYDDLNNTFFNLTGIYLYRGHKQKEDLFKKSHRFISMDTEGLFLLSKHLYKLLIEDIDIDLFKRYIKVPKGENWQSIKLIEEFLSLSMTNEEARKLKAPLAGLNKLRQADAHLSSDNFIESLELLDIQKNVNAIEQGYQLLYTVVSTLFIISEQCKKTKLK